MKNYKSGFRMPKWLIIVVIFIAIIGIVANLGDDEEYQNKTEENEYTITFMNEGNKISEIKVSKGSLITPPENPTKENYTFSHWATHEHSIDGSEKYDFNVPPTKSNTLFAHFTYTPQNANDNDNSDDNLYGYERIYKEYSDKLKKECPKLSMNECAEIATDGVEEMADYMLSASGTDGQYATYEKWAGKLMDIYMKEAR